MPRRTPVSRAAQSPSPAIWAALADHALAMGHEEQALVLIEEAFAACDRKHIRLELVEAA